MNVTDLAKQKVRENEMRELRQFEERDPELIKNWSMYLEMAKKEMKAEEPKEVKDEQPSRETVKVQVGRRTTRKNK